MYNKKSHIHFVGIGGIGMSGIATILKYQGYTISGCDKDLDQKSIANLQSIGCEIYEGNNTPCCHSKNIDTVVYSSAIKPDDPEIIAAQIRGIPTISRAHMLAELMRTKHSIAIAGAHGKTTTTSLISHILLEAKLDPTIIIGGHLKTISTNAYLGNGDFLVAEADESDRSLLHLHATVAVVTNIDLEHLETYRDLADIKQTFSHFLGNLPFYGKAIVCIDDDNIQSILPIPHIKTLKYGIENHNEADIYAHNINLNPDSCDFEVWLRTSKEPFAKIHLTMPGIHNVQNALAAITLAYDLGIPFNQISNALNNFKGIDRRFTFKGTFNEIEIFDDYGHHPKEIEHTLVIAKKRTKKGLTVLFQPHRYTRTQRLWNDFVKLFAESQIDHLFITDIYPASEIPIEGISGKSLVDAIKQVNSHISATYIPYNSDLIAIKKEIVKTLRPGDLLLLQGAGKVNKITSMLL